MAKFKEGDIVDLKLPGKTYAGKVYVAVSDWEFKKEIEPKINKKLKTGGTFKSFARTMKERNNKN